MPDAKTNESVFAVVPAAGVGQRMGASLAKQYLPLMGKTILEHTLSTLLDVSEIKSIVVVVSPVDSHWKTLPVFNDPKITVVDGGEQRSHSVLNGLQALSQECAAEDWVLVHDVARPCVGLAEIDRMFSVLRDDHVGGILAVPCTDTIKQVTAQSIDQTVDRDLLWRAQTPQMFRYQLLLTAMKEGLEQGLTITDEASAIELAGHHPKVIEGSSTNIKITCPDDLPLAEFYLQNSRSSCA